VCINDCLDFFRFAMTTEDTAEGGGATRLLYSAHKTALPISVISVDQW
jgi:hypothetical protein